MRRIGVFAVGLLIAALSAAALAASALAAPPEFSPPFPKPFNASSGVTVIESAAATKIQCVTDVAGGEVQTPQGGTMTIRLMGCELVLAVGKIPCMSPGAAPEEIILKGVTQLGYIVHTPLKTQVGLDLSNPTGAPLAEFICGEKRGLITGSVIGKITPINKLVKAGKPFTLKFAQAKGKQKPKKFEGAPEDAPSISFGGPFEPAGIGSTELITFAEPVTIIA
jgi:hypothetical protein